MRSRRDDPRSQVGRPPEDIPWNRTSADWLRLYAEAEIRLHEATGLSATAAEPEVTRAEIERNRLRDVLLAVLDQQRVPLDTSDDRVQVQITARRWGNQEQQMITEALAGGLETTVADLLADSGISNVAGGILRCDPTATITVQAVKAEKRERP